jgi:hypothetical protein
MFERQDDAGIVDHDYACNARVSRVRARQGAKHAQVQARSVDVRTSGSASLGLPPLERSASMNYVPTTDDVT